MGKRNRQTTPLYDFTPSRLCFSYWRAGPSWWSISDTNRMQIHLAKIKADILCELVAVSVVRSEFDTAEKVGLLLPVLPQTLQFFNRK